jgi:hypothetical protein
MAEIQNRKAAEDHQRGAHPSRWQAGDLVPCPNLWRFTP